MASSRNVEIGVGHGGRANWAGCFCKREEIHLHLGKLAALSISGAGGLERN